jgi:hypothetical protein
LEGQAYDYQSGLIFEVITAVKMMLMFWVFNVMWTVSPEDGSSISNQKKLVFTYKAT